MAPVLNVRSISVAQGQSVQASSMILSVFDQYPVTYYAFLDAGSGGGYFTYNNAVQPAGQWIYVSASNLSLLKYIGGSASGSETVYADAWDNITGWGSVASLTASTTAAPTHIDPTLTAQHAYVSQNATIQASSLFSISNPSGDNISTYWFYDSGVGGAHFILNNVNGFAIAEPVGAWFSVSAANLAHLHYVGAATASNDTIYTYFLDATTGKYSAVQTLTETTVGMVTPRLSNDITIAKNEITEQVKDGMAAPLAWHLTDNSALVKQIATDLSSALNGHFAIDSAGYLYPTNANLVNYHQQQCVDLVLAVDGNLPVPTINWHIGAAVALGSPNGLYVNPSLSVGTPIATFGSDGKYISNGNGHAAIFLSSGTENNVAGVFVLDQYNTTGSLAPHALLTGSYEPAEIRFIGLNDSAIGEYHAFY